MTNAEAAYPDRRQAWWLIVILFCASIVSVFDRGILNVVVDPVRADLGLTDVQIGLLQGLAFGLFYATVGLPLGLTADRWARRGLVVGGITVWSLATVAGGFAQSFGAMFAARLLVGLGEAALAPATISLIADLFPPEKRGRPISFFLTGQAVANGLSISTTSLLTEAAATGHFAGVPVLGALAPWRVAFVCCGLAGFIVVAALLTTREPPRRGAILAPDLGRQALVSLRFLGSKAGLFVPLYLGFALSFLAAYGVGNWAPTMLTREFGATRMQIGQWLGPISVAFSVVGPTIGGVLIDRYARRKVTLARFYLLAIAPLCVIPSALAVFAPRLMPAIVLVASLGAFAAVIGTTVMSILQSMVPPSSRGFAVALTGLVNTLIGSTSAPLLISLVTERIYQNPAKVGFAIPTVVVPALLAASAMFLVAGAAARRAMHDPQAS